MPDFHRSILAFQRQLPDEAACAFSLSAARLPGGFRCPACGPCHQGVDPSTCPHWQIDQLCNAGEPGDYAELHH